MIFLSACQSGPQTSKEGLQFSKGKAQVIDKLKEKEEWVYFNSTIRYPRQMRMDVALGLLNIGLGTLVITDNKATLVSAVEGKAYVTDDGTELLTKLMKTEIAPQDVIAIFAEKFPIRNWQCSGGNNKVQCAKGEIMMDWEAVSGNDRRLVLESPRSKVSFVYKKTEDGKRDFDQKIPKGFKVITL